MMVISFLGTSMLLKIVTRIAYLRAATVSSPTYVFSSLLDMGWACIVRPLLLTTHDTGFDMLRHFGTKRS
ncbi:hypothetical protein AXW67_31150 [Bradyrhizobium neotropicale]|uniref:Uncharacterized protein n=1 Tax=Bradyrhizobium neotropicale TaxID=1497615 RepID=A0A176YJD7_9BRAD|nr:hypothetical protein AXW67_31150 [Bradyrhizobium neotropicale]